MSSDTDKHRALLEGLKAAMGEGAMGEGASGKGTGAFEQAVTAAFEHVFEHLERLNSHVSEGGRAGEDRPLKDGESSTLR